jgi:invasion protein IalB
MLNLIFKLKILCLIILSLSAASKTTDEIIEATFDDWLKVCTRSAQNCVGVTFAENESGKRVARFVLDLAPTGRAEIKALGTLLIPYETAIPHLLSGMIMKLDQQKPIKEQFYFCDKNGCNVRYQFTVEGLNLIKLGSNILIKFKDVRDLKTIKTMDISLRGIKPLLSSIE